MFRQWYTPKPFAYWRISSFCISINLSMPVDGFWNSHNFFAHSTAKTKKFGSMALTLENLGFRAIDQMFGVERYGMASKRPCK